MGRKNRKGRTSRQRPRRRYNSDQRQRDQRPGRTPLRKQEPVAADGAALALFPEASLLQEERADGSLSLTCGRCREWLPAPDSLANGGRGECLHPASGIAYPPPDTPACPYFTH